MKFEKIKKVKLLVSLKSGELGKQMVWLAGTVFDKEIKPFPSAIVSELSTGRPRIFEILETYPEPKDKIEKVVEEVKEQETPKEVPSESKTRLKKRQK